MGAVDGPSTMMSFKAFLAAQDDSITVDDAIQKYNEYKLEFRRQQLNEFFVAHKDEEWYASLYFVVTTILASNFFLKIIIVQEINT